MRRGSKPAKSKGESKPLVARRSPKNVGAAEKKVEDTGLGLTLCRKFIELHRGRIWVKSQLGQGATFAFTIPVRRRGE
jgi:light-regulated signal transduction histidine kinase (bacteriophytochrome)